MRTLSASSGISAGPAPYMTGLSSLVVSPSALPSGSSRSLRVVAQFSTSRMASESLAKMVALSRSHELSTGTGAPSSPPRKMLTTGARIAVVPLSSVGSGVTTPSAPPVSRVSQTPAIVVARSAERARALSEHLASLLAHRATTPPATSSSPASATESEPHEPQDRDRPAPSAPLGTVVLAGRGRHRGPYHRGPFRRGRALFRRRLYGRLPRLRGALDRLFRAHGVRRRGVALPPLALTSGPGHGSIEAHHPTDERTDAA